MNQLFEKLNKIINETETETKNEKCNHKNSVLENEITICIFCGQELEKKLNGDFDFQNRVQKK